MSHIMNRNITIVSFINDPYEHIDMETIHRHAIKANEYGHYIDLLTEEELNTAFLSLTNNGKNVKWKSGVAPMMIHGASIVYTSDPIITRSDLAAAFIRFFLDV